jgi:hypothetical protein
VKGWIKKIMKKWLRKDASAAMFFLVPSGIGFALFYLIPFVMGVYYSFMSQSVDGRFVGLDNYLELLGSASFRKAASNTFYFSAVSIPLMVMLSLGLAMLLHQNTYFQKWLRTAYVLPQEKLIDLSAEVPLHMKQNKLQLQLTEPAVEGKISFPAAHYKIPYAQEGKSHLGVENIMENAHGTFGVKLSSYQRVPQGDVDQIVAQISIRNTTSSTVALPEFKAAVKAGMRDLSGTAQIVVPNDQTTLAPNETMELYVLANVPYSYLFNQLRVDLQETSGEDVHKFLSLNTNSVNNVMKQVAAGESYLIHTPGKKAEVRERLTTVYQDNSSNVIYTELVMASQETRQSKQAQLVAYYKTPENEFFEAKISQFSDKTSPNGKSLVTVWSKLPQHVNPSQLVLYVGEGVSNGKMTDVGEESTGSINTVGLALSPRVAQPATNLQNVELFPYHLTITRGEGTLSAGKDMLNTVIHYNLSRNGDYETGLYDHKLIMELIDPTGQSTEKTLTLGTDLTIGNNKSYSINLNSNFSTIVSGGAIRINLYDEFQGRRMLLGSQGYPFTYEEDQTKRTDSD